VNTRPSHTKTTATSDDYYDDDSKEDLFDPVKQSDICGVGPARKYNSDGHRIVGGSDATPNSWPFMVKFLSNQIIHRKCKD
jgi:hypothetical protein